MSNVGAYGVKKDFKHNITFVVTGFGQKRKSETRLIWPKCFYFGQFLAKNEVTPTNFQFFDS